jgi:hypothetical protein
MTLPAIIDAAITINSAPPLTSDALRWIVIKNCCGKTIKVWGRNQTFTLPNQQTLYYVGSARSLTYSEFIDFSWPEFPSVAPWNYQCTSDPRLGPKNASGVFLTEYSMTDTNSVVPTAVIPTGYLNAKFTYAEPDDFLPVATTTTRPQPKGAAQFYRLVSGSDYPFTNAAAYQGTPNAPWTLTVFKARGSRNQDVTNDTLFWMAFQNCTGMPLNFTATGSNIGYIGRGGIGFYVGSADSVLFTIAR